jgi:hypothetical protein
MRTPETLRQHAHDVAHAFKVALAEDARRKPEEAFALPNLDDESLADLQKELRKYGKTTVVACAPIRDETAYAVALHELGHVLHPTGFLMHEKVRAMKDDEPFRWSNLRLLEEQSAWEWAHQNALGGEWSVAMQQVETYAIGTYLEAKRQFEAALVKHATMMAMHAAGQARNAADPARAKREATERAQKGAAVLAGWLRPKGRK